MAACCASCRPGLVDVASWEKRKKKKKNSATLLTSDLNLTVVIKRASTPCDPHHPPSYTDLPPPTTAGKQLDITAWHRAKGCLNFCRQKKKKNLVGILFKRFPNASERKTCLFPFKGGPVYYLKEAGPSNSRETRSAHSAGVSSGKLHFDP